MTLRCSQALLGVLRESKLPMSFTPKNTYDYTVPWHPDGVTFDTHRGHVLTYCADVQVALEESIKSALRIRNAPEHAVDDCVRETVKHLLFANAKAQSFVGRGELLAQLDTLWNGLLSPSVGAAPQPPSVVVGESGAGKTALMAMCFARCRAAFPDATATVICRFVGVTPQSSTALSLVRSIVDQIAHVYDASGVNNGNLPDDYKTLCSTLPQYLALATAERPIVLFIDSLVCSPDFIVQRADYCAIVSMESA